MVEHYATCVRDGDVPVSDGEQGLRVVRILAAAQESLQQRRHPRRPASGRSLSID